MAQLTSLHPLRQACARVIDISKLSGETVKFSTIVTLVDGETGASKKLQIVGEPVADAR